MKFYKFYFSFLLFILMSNSVIAQSSKEFFNVKKIHNEKSKGEYDSLEVSITLTLQSLDFDHLELRYGSKESSGDLLAIDLYKKEDENGNTFLEGRDLKYFVDKSRTVIITALSPPGKVKKKYINLIAKDKYGTVLQTLSE